MNTVTLTSDYGTESHYVAQVKGALLKAGKGQFNIVDISNRIAAFDINDAAFILKNSYPFFPEGTVHLIGVNNQVAEGTRQLLALAGKQFFMAADIGILPLVFSDSDTVYYDLGPEWHTCAFVTRDCYPEMLRRLAESGFDPVAAGLARVNDPVVRLSEKPIIRDNFLRATVVYIDSFGNAFINLDKAYFDEFVGDSKFVFKILREEFRGVLHKDYAEAEPGEVVFMFKSSEHLQVALNKGRADQYLGLKKNTHILIEKL